ncbi:peptidase domain-containing ABC transporter [Flavobacterium silvaticum]|uniref:Peptidase domain-containing ABC transporter n=1 Tax=Flavobacterium silvaticum TaxID=1852020 RepID=A0A972FRG0_9FLAO|nr:peptidase domain-containing ABC transporter [Flavobacterium silvaticum]NMH28009.1 peptidase domain-containing ABC transporter [Flavobacterium silvaticum]
MARFPFYKQPDSKDCGPTCIRIIAKFYGKNIELQQIRNLSETTREGSTLLGLSDAAEAMGFRTLGLRINYETLESEVQLPCIAHWSGQHFVVVYKISKDTVYLSDPSYGLISYPKDEFIKFWIGKNAHEKTEEGIVLYLEPTPDFHKSDWDTEDSPRSFAFLSRYLIRYKSLVIQLIIGLAAGSIFSLLFPFLTQSLVDTGIQTQNLHFIYLILLAQLMLFVGQTTIEVLRSWIMLHLSTRIHISLVSDFFIKLMKLPISYFDTRMTGDIMQRIGDNHRIEQLLTGNSLNAAFSIVNFFIFSFVLAFYNVQLFGIFLAGSTAYILWIAFFLKKRKELDYKRFGQVASEQSKVMELINGMQEIKMQNAEKQKRWGWEFVQIRLFKVSMQSLSLEQWQSVGSNCINQLKDLLITFFAATLVVKGDLTLGMMLSVQYIIGQLNNPLMQLVEFVRQLQDAKISLERLGEIHDKEDEENPSDPKIHDFEPAALSISKLSFRYTGNPDYVLTDINLIIPKEKTTAIVGTSGSGKTTLLKLLMKFYEPTGGEIKLGNMRFPMISPSAWRTHCGVVMQDGFIFNDTIANNIAVGDDRVDKARLLYAVETANIREFIESLPLSYNTKIGNEGTGISGGQKQRLLIARAVYKNPDYLFFDEATSSLDANNEKVIMENLDNFLKGKTAIIIAHRLSTVKNADQIVVLEKGEIVEIGTHKELISNRKNYFELVKNQLELGD